MIRVQYVQLTLGPPHLARIRALDACAGIECRGLALASEERTRRAVLSEPELQLVYTALRGRYEDIPWAKRISGVAKHLLRTRPDVLIIDAASDPVQFAAGRMVQALGGKSLLRWASTRLDRSRRRWKEHLKLPAYRGWNGYLCTGRRASEYLASFGVEPARQIRCGNPVDAEYILRARDERLVRAERSGFLFVGRLIQEKNLPRLLSAYRSYREGGGSWSLSLAGFGTCERELRFLARELEGVAFLGNLQRPALVEAYLSAGCLVLPSVSETWGLVVNEAMHARLPVIASQACGCVPELLGDASPWVFDERDANALAATMRRMSDLNRAQRAQLATANEARVELQTTEHWAEAVAERIRTL